MQHVNENENSGSDDESAVVRKQKRVIHNYMKQSVSIIWSLV